MKKTTTIFLTALMLIAVLFTNCKKEPGPKGDTGATGAQGPAGPAAKYYDISKVFSSSTNSASYALPNVLNTGDVVLVYVLDTYSFKYILPYKGSLTTATSITDNFDLTYSVGSITVFLENKTTLSNVHIVYFKIVVISASAIKQNPNLDYSNFDQVQQVFKIKD
jgi:hypothetical protein